MIIVNTAYVGTWSKLVWILIFLQPIELCKVFLNEVNLRRNFIFQLLISFWFSFNSCFWLLSILVLFTIDLLLRWYNLRLWSLWDFITYIIFFLLKLIFIIKTFSTVFFFIFIGSSKYVLWILLLYKRSINMQEKGVL